MASKEAIFRAFQEAGLLEEMSPREAVIVSLISDPGARISFRASSKFSWPDLIPPGIDPRIINSAKNPGVIDPIWPDFGLTPIPEPDGPPGPLTPTCTYDDWYKRVASVPDDVWDKYGQKLDQHFTSPISASGDIGPVAVLPAFVAGMAVGYAAYAYAAKY